jgi:hypothetical protein
MSLSTAHAGADERVAPEAASSLSLRHLVDVARRNKAAELAAATARLAGEPRASGEPAAPARGIAPAGMPRLWSLMAVGDRWRAEVLLEGRLHAVDASSGPQTRVGPWRVLGLAPEGLRFEQVAAGKHPPRELVLPPPGRGAAAASYRFGSGGLPSPGRSEPTSVERAGDDDDAAVHRAAALPLPAVPAVPAVPAAPTIPAPPGASSP